MEVNQSDFRGQGQSGGGQVVAVGKDDSSFGENFREALISTRLLSLTHFIGHPFASSRLA